MKTHRIAAYCWVACGEKHKAGKSCIYIKRLADLDIDILKKMIVGSVKYTKRQYPS
jgi:hypothetical protein